MSGGRPTREAYRPLKETYARQAPDYHRRWHGYTEATLSATFTAIPDEAFTRILDAACGPGLFLQAARHRWTETILVGIDLTREMLVRARERLRGDPRTLFVCSMAEAIPFPAGCFDLVVCSSSFHHFRAPQRSLAEFRRVLRPGGTLVLTDWCDDYLACKVCDLWLRLVDRSHFRTYGLEECTELLRAARFQVLDSRRFKINWLWGMMTVRAQAPANNPELDSEAPAVAMTHSEQAN
jgi:ubiquinone/menaquinone biosynthesis C-methylase UbiE